ncbi:unnamed protein product [Rotaria sp. Silwood2]|nr:unnamed protein product [Rotaria sp. Silwood2]
MEQMPGSSTSVHIGQFSMDHANTTFRTKPEYRSRLHGPNSILYNAAARLSYHFNLHGPNISFDVACSSSLEAVHLAVQTLRTGEADMTVCGGVNAVYTPEALLMQTKLKVVSISQSTNVTTTCDTTNSLDSYNNKILEKYKRLSNSTMGDWVCLNTCPISIFEDIGLKNIIDQCIKIGKIF